MKRAEVSILLVVLVLSVLPGVLAISDTDISDYSHGGTCNWSTESSPVEYSKFEGYYPSGPYWIFKDGASFIDTSAGATSPNSCYFYNITGDNWITSREDYNGGGCCPDGFTCKTHADYPNSPENASCQFYSPTTALCRDFKNELDCNATNWDIAKNDYNAKPENKDSPVSKPEDLIEYYGLGGPYGSAQDCAITTLIYCEWDVGDGQCELREEIEGQDTFREAGCMNIGAVCQYNGTETQSCDEINDERIIYYTAKGTNDTVTTPREPSFFDQPGFDFSNRCKDYEATLLCDASVKLPFFGYMNFLLSVLGLFVVYLVFSKKLGADV